MAAGKTIGGINVTISATIDKFQKSMTAARRILGQFQKSISSTIFSVKGLAAALAGGFAIRSFVRMTAEQFKQIDALKDLSDKLGVATDKLAGLQLAASEAGISNEVLERGLTKLSTTMGLRGDAALRKWIEDTSKLTSNSERLSAAVDMFGTRGSAMVRFLGGGTKALDEAQRAAESLGLAISNQTARGVDRALEAFARFKMAVGGIFRSIAVELTPYIEVLSNAAVDVLAKGGMGKGIGKGIANFIIKAVKTIADLIQKMVAGVLRMAAAAYEMILQIRGSGLGGKLGLTAPSVEEFETMGRMRNKAAFLEHERNMPSVWIDKMIKKAQEKAAAQEQKAGGASLGTIGRIAGGALRSIIGEGNINNAKNLMGNLPGMRNAMQLKFYEMMGGLSAMRANNMKPIGSLGGGTSSSLSGFTMQDPLSREGSSQRVRSIAAVGLQKTADKQLAEQKAIRRGIDKIASAPPMRIVQANLA